MKEKYLKPQTELNVFHLEDVITTSGGTGQNRTEEIHRQNTFVQAGNLPIHLTYHLKIMHAQPPPVLCNSSFAPETFCNMRPFWPSAPRGCPSR